VRERAGCGQIVQELHHKGLAATWDRDLVVAPEPQGTAPPATPSPPPATRFDTNPKLNPHLSTHAATNPNTTLVNPGRSGWRDMHEHKESWLLAERLGIVGEAKGRERGRELREG
ncbi:unnamed protein product, partial [Discosporangium mesarthrocarpum]